MRIAFCFTVPHADLFLKEIAQPICGTKMSIHRARILTPPQPSPRGVGRGQVAWQSRKMAQQPVSSPGDLGLQ